MALYWIEDVTRRLYRNLSVSIQNDYNLSPGEVCWVYFLFYFCDKANEMFVFDMQKCGVTVAPAEMSHKANKVTQ